MSNSETRQTLPWEAAFSSTIQRARKSAQMSPEEFARRLREYGLSVYANTVEEIESGTRPIRLNEALVISRVLDVEFPQVTRTLPAELISEAYSKELEKAEREWDKVVAALSATYRGVLRVRQGFLNLHTSYIEDLAPSNGSPDEDLDARMKAIGEQTSRVKENLDGIDNDLGGALSKPGASASVPGSQDQWSR